MSANLIPYQATKPPFRGGFFICWVCRNPLVVLVCCPPAIHCLSTGLSRDVSELFA